MKNATLSLFLIFLSVALYAQPKRLYTPNGQLHSTLSNGIGIVEDKPAAALHIRESEHHATAFRIDVVNKLIPGPPGQNNYTQPEFAFKINSNHEGHPGLTHLASLDGKGIMRVGNFYYGSEQVQVSNSLGIYQSSSNSLSLQYDGSNPQLFWKTNSNKNFRFKNSNTGAVPISLSPSGKVGINTEDFFGDHDLYVNGSVYLKGDSPETHTMYIEGSAIAEEMFIQLKSGAGWGDFVFHSNYPLLPLNELQDFIDANGHLPEMPTAEKVARDGLETGETIRLLNIKVEELTLYILQQQKEIETLKKEFTKN